MNAKEAKAITESAAPKGPPDVRHLLEYVYSQIETAARNGRAEVFDPLQGIRTMISGAQRLAVYSKLRDEGYAVEARPTAFDRVQVRVSWE